MAFVDGLRPIRYLSCRILNLIGTPERIARYLRNLVRTRPEIKGGAYQGNLIT